MGGARRLSEPGLRDLAIWRMIRAATEPLPQFEEDHKVTIDLAVLPTAWDSA